VPGVFRLEKTYSVAIGQQTAALEVTLADSTKELWKTWFSGLHKKRTDLAAGTRKAFEEGRTGLRQEEIPGRRLVAVEAEKMANQNEAVLETSLEDLWIVWYAGLRKRNSDLAAKMKKAFEDRQNSLQQRNTFKREAAGRGTGKR
jgi:hypothetical protein